MHVWSQAALRDRFLRHLGSMLRTEPVSIGAVVDLLYLLSSLDGFTLPAEPLAALLDVATERTSTVVNAHGGRL